MPDNNIFGVDFIARCLAGEGLETANKRQWKLQAGPRIILSDNPATQTTTISATGDDITVDDELSLVSENPVQNKVITDALRYKPDTVINGGTKVANQKIMQLTRQQYDAIQEKDPNTYYMITDDVDTIVLRTAYVDVTDDAVITVDSNTGSRYVTFDAPEDFEMLEARINYEITWSCGAWNNQTTGLTSILTITPDDTAPPRDGRKVYMGVTEDRWLGEAPNQTHVNEEKAALIGSTRITYDSVTNKIRIEITKPYYNYVNTDPDDLSNIELTINNFEVNEVGYVAYGSDNINITHDSYTAGTGIAIDNNNRISLDANYGATIELDVNSSTYVVTATLRDQNNNVLSTDTIDLPLESVVVSGSYDSQTEKIVLTLQNGNTIEFSVASLVSGLEETSNKVTTITNASTNTEYPSAAAVYSFVNGQSYDEVPDVGSNDDGKILTASYSGGTGSYAWTAPQTFSQQQADWTEADSSAVDYIKNKPNLAAVATSGSYTDLSDKPSIPAAQVNADWNASSGVAEILNKPTLGTAAAADTTDFATATQGGLADTAVQPADLATVATTGSYSDLSNKPTIPAAQVNADWNSSSGVSEILNKPTLATVATSGSYNDLSNKPTIPAAQIQSDWNQTNNQALDYIKNKPNIPAAQVNSDWSAASGVSQILNKPDLSIYLTSSDLSGYATENYVDGKVPDTTQYDEGKYLTVGSNGNEWSLIDEVPDIGSGDDGKVLTASYSGGVGSYSWQAAGSGGTSDYTDLSNKPAIENHTLAAGNNTAASLGLATTSDISDMATQTWVGQQGYLTSADEVPTVTSNDDGKVLTATYSGGVGSYAWASAGGGGGGLSVETDGTNYWITVNGIRLYFASSAPTGTIPTGSYGIGW